MEENLLKGCKKGDRLAQKELYEKYYGRMMGVCLRYTSNRDEAAEILNKGFFKVFNSIKQYKKASGRLDSWIYKIMVNTAVDHYRSEIKHRMNIVGIEQAYYLNEQDTVIPELNAADIIKLIQQLTPGYRVVFNLYVMEGLTHKEISEKLEISIGTCKSNLAKARKKLQEMLVESSEVKLERYAR